MNIQKDLEEFFINECELRIGHPTDGKTCNKAFMYEEIVLKGKGSMSCSDFCNVFCEKYNHQYTTEIMTLFVQERLKFLRSLIKRVSRPVISFD